MPAATKDGTWLQAIPYVEVSCPKHGVIAKVAEPQVIQVLRSHANEEHGGLDRGY